MKGKTSFFTLIMENPQKAAQLVRTWLHSNVEDKKKCNGRQKAALFFIIIGSEISSEVFKYLHEEEMEEIAFEITNFDAVDLKQKKAIIKESRKLITANQFITTWGIDYARDLLETSLEKQKAIDIINRLRCSSKPFDFISRTDPMHLLNFIQQEHPQVIALVLSNLESKNASIILRNLPPELQSDVTRRIACMDSVSPEICREIERVLEKKLSTLSCEDDLATGGIEGITKILNLVDGTSKKHIIGTLEDEDPDLSQEIKKRSSIIRKLFGKFKSVAFSNSITI